MASLHAAPRLIKQIKKKICKLFESKGLRIIIEANKKRINFLDVTLDLKSGKHYPFMKPGNKPKRYVHAKSNHPPCIIKHIPEIRVLTNDNQIPHPMKWYLIEQYLNIRKP